MIYLYNSIQAKQGFYKLKKVSESIFKCPSLFGDVNLNISQLNILSNVSVVETIEQINYLVNEYKICTLEEIKDHIEKLVFFKKYCRSSVVSLLTKWEKDLAYVTA